MITVGDVIARVNTHFNEGDNGAYTLQEKLQWVDVAVKNLADKLPADLLQELVKTEIISLGGTPSKYLLPTDFLKVISASYGTNGSEKVCAIHGVSKERLIDRNMDYASTINNPIAIIKNNEIKMFPTIAGATVVLTYIKQPAGIPQAVESKTLALELPNYLELIFYDVLIHAYGRDRQPEMNTYLTIYYTSLSDVITRGLYGGNNIKWDTIRCSQ